MRKKTYNKDTAVYRNKLTNKYFSWEQKDVNIYDADTYDINSRLVGPLFDFGTYIRVNFYDEIKRIRKMKLDEINK